MHLDRLVVDDPSISKMTHFADLLWREHPDIVASIGEENIDVVPVGPTVGGSGVSNRVRTITFNFEVNFQAGMSPARAALLARAVAVIREVASAVGIELNEQVDDFLNHVDEQADSHPDG